MSKGRKNFAALVVGHGQRIMVIGNGTSFHTGGKREAVHNNTEIETYLVD